MPNLEQLYIKNANTDIYSIYLCENNIKQVRNGNAVLFKELSLPSKQTAPVNTSSKYPQVIIKKTANIKNKQTAPAEDKPVMFFCFTGDIGPTNTLTKINSYSEFTNTFGNIFTKSYKNPEYLNCLNWLNNGGSILAIRISIGEDKQCFAGFEKAVKNNDSYQLTTENIGF